MTKLITSIAIVVIAGTFIFLNSCKTPKRKQLDKLDIVDIDTGVVKELKDVYRVYRLNDKIDEIKDDFSLYYQSDSVTAENVLRNSLSKCDKFKNYPFFDDSIKTLANLHIDKFNIVNKSIINKGIASEEFGNAFEQYKKCQEQYNGYLFGKYSTNHFIKMSEDEYWKNIDKQQYIHSPEYAHYLSLAKTDLNGSMELLNKIISNTKNFQEKSIYQIELANTMIHNFNKLDSNNKIGRAHV